MGQLRVGQLFYRIEGQYPLFLGKNGVWLSAARLSGNMAKHKNFLNNMLGLYLYTAFFEILPI